MLNVLPIATKSHVCRCSKTAFESIMGKGENAYNNLHCLCFLHHYVHNYQRQISSFEQLFFCCLQII